MHLILDWIEHRFFKTHLIYSIIVHNLVLREKKRYIFVYSIPNLVVVYKAFKLGAKHTCDSCKSCSCCYAG